MKPRWWVVLLFFLPDGTSLGAEERPLQDDDPPKAWHERVELGGDFRFRYEGFRQDGRFDDGRRDRLRYRLRLGLDVEISDFLRLGGEVRSGNPRNPVSDNQTLTGAFDKDRISIAEAYADVRLSDALSVVAGKFSHGDRWSVSDMHWDSDVVLEGAFENLRFDGVGALEEIGISLYQLVLVESGGGDDAWLLGFQVQPQLELSERSTLTVGGGFDYYVEPQLVVERTLEGELAGNDVTNLLDDSGALVSDFHILNVFAEWESRLSERWPLEVSVYGYRNTGAADRIGIEAGITGARAVASDPPVSAYYMSSDACRKEAPADEENPIFEIPFGWDGADSETSRRHLLDEHYLVNEFSTYEALCRVWDTIVERSRREERPQIVSILCHTYALDDATFRDRCARILDYMREHGGTPVTAAEAKAAYDELSARGTAS